MTEDRFEVILYSLVEGVKGQEESVSRSSGDSRDTANKIDDMEKRIEQIQSKLGSNITTKTDRKTRNNRPKGYNVSPEKNWELICSEAKRNLRQRGVNIESISMDQLLDQDEISRIENRFRGGFSLKSNLDTFDKLAIVVAGLVAAIVDFVIVKIPTDITYIGNFQQEGSALTKWMQSNSIDSENWLGRHFKTSYDTVRSVMGDIEGFSPRTHRLQTFGHDPLIGLIIGTIDIMRGGLTGVSRSGELVFLSNIGDPNYNPFLAFVTQIMHLFSDAFTKMGVPAPGWSLLQLFQHGSFGDKERTVGEVARWMYLNGYDTRHFLTMSTSVAAAEVVLRGYFWARRKLDEEYNSEVEHDGIVAGAKNTGEHPRFQAMAFGAHGLAAAANIGKVAIYQGNPLAINYAQWLRFLHAMFKWTQTKLRSPSDVLKGHAQANLQEIQQGWPVIEVEDPTFPTLIVHQ
jgi:hypothetical protein